MFALLLVALLVTLGVAIVGWFRPLPPKPPAPPTYNAQQVADAKTKVCADYQKVHSAIKASSSRDKGTDPTSQLVFAINGQQAILTGSEYLRTTLSQQPALMFAVKGFDRASSSWFSPGAHFWTTSTAGDRAERRRLSKLSCAGWLPHDPGSSWSCPI